MSVISTARGTGVLNTETRRVRDVSDGIFKLEPNAAPLIAMMARLKKKQAKDPKIEWFEDESLPRFDALAADSAAGDSTMTVTNFAYFRADDLWQINDKEIVRVTATPTTTSVTIKRGVGVVYTSGVAASSGQRLRLIATSAQENNSARALLSTQKVPKFNYTEIFRHPFAVSRTAMQSDSYGGKDLMEEQANQLIEHRKDIEMAFLIGERYEDTTGTHPQRNTQGIIPYLSTHIVDAGGTLTEPSFEQFLRRAFRFGSKQKLLIGSSAMLTVVNGWARGKLETVPADKSYGISLNKYMNSGREVLLVEHPLLENELLSDLSGLAGYGLVVDIQDLTLRHIGPSLAQLKTNIQANDVDGREDQYLSECGLESHLEKKHALLKGVIA